MTTRHLEWRPRGDQSTWLTDPGPHQKDILINKLRPGHEMDIKLFAVKVKLNLIEQFHGFHDYLLPVIRMTNNKMKNI